MNGWYTLTVAAACWGPLVAAARPAMGQPTSGLAEIAKKKQFSAEDRDAIAARMREVCGELSRARSERDAREARMRLLAEVKQGTPEFRAAAVTAGLEELRGIVSSTNLLRAQNAALAVAELEHPLAIEALEEGLRAPLGSVRYQSAQGLRRLQGQMNRVDQVRSVLAALGGAGEVEPDLIVLRAIYQALDFSGVPNFEWADEVETVLGRLLAVRARRGGGEFHPADHIEGFKTALRMAGKLKRPSVAGVEGLSLMLRAFVAAAAADRGSVRADMVEDCEVALRELIKNGAGSAPQGPLIADLLRRNADPKEVDAALRELIGDARVEGLLNKPPWSLPRGLAAAEGSAG